MSLEMIMNGAGDLDHSDGSIVSGGVFTIVSEPSEKMRASGQGVYRGPLLYTFAGGSSEGFVDGTVATTVPQSIPPTAEKIRTEGLPVIRLGDAGQMAAVGTLTGGGAGPVVGVVEVADAGQDRVSAQ